jgi:hypothetical protein
MSWRVKLLGLMFAAQGEGDDRVTFGLSGGSLEGGGE